MRISSAGFCTTNSLMNVYLAFRWGFKRIEDICWIKTNKDVGKRKYLSAVNQEPGSMLVHTKVNGGMGVAHVLHV